jgi:hypothetical protein
MQQSANLDFRATSVNQPFSKQRVDTIYKCDFLLNFISTQLEVLTMDPVRASLGGGIVATFTVLLFLLGADFLLGGTHLFVFATFTGPCAVGGPPYCDLGSVSALVLTSVVFLALYVVAWPLLFGGLIWGLPGESGIAHGFIFDLVLWSGFATVAWINVWRGWESFSSEFTLVLAMLIAYLIYGSVLGSVYDRLAEHRTFLSQEEI